LLAGSWVRGTKAVSRQAGGQAATAGVLRPPTLEGAKHKSIALTTLNLFFFSTEQF
jgi:hypothetical protein